MDTTFSSTDDASSQENLPLRDRGARVNDAEKIRQDFIRSRHLITPPQSGSPIPNASGHDER